MLNTPLTNALRFDVIHKGTVGKAVLEAGQSGSYYVNALVDYCSEHGIDLGSYSGYDVSRAAWTMKVLFGGDPVEYVFYIELGD